jgi:hypothetical protein
MTSIPKPLFFNDVEPELKKYLTEESWKWLEEKSWKVLWRLVKLKQSGINEFFVKTRFSLEKAFVGISDLDTIPQERNKEIIRYMSSKLKMAVNIFAKEFSFSNPVKYINKILWIVFECLRAAPFDLEERPAQILDIENALDCKILSWAIIFERPYAVQGIIKQMAISDVIDALSIKLIDQIGIYDK